MLTGIHFLLTYMCNFECDHCFLYCSPSAKGTFTISQVDQVLEEAEKIGTIEWIFFEGGEPSLFYPLLLESIRRSSSKGFKVGLVTNAYGINSREDAVLWLEPLAKAGLTYLSISNDAFHYGEQVVNNATMAHDAAKELGIDTAMICIDPPVVEPPEDNSDTDSGEKGQPVVGGNAMFRGRAVETLTKGLPTRPWKDLITCPYENLESPSRVHIDAFGNVQICQGISMGNMWQTPLSELVEAYDPLEHPICSSLIHGGPAHLSTYMDQKPSPGYVDECHFCFTVRKEIMDKFPNFLAPGQVYGI